MKHSLGVLEPLDVVLGRVEQQVLSLLERTQPLCLETRRPTRSLVQKWMLEGRIEDATGRKVGRKSRLEPGTELFCDLLLGSPQLVGCYEGPEVKVLYEDNDLLVVDKPAGLVTHRAPSVKGPVLVDWVLKQGYALAPQGLPDRPGVVHRLDQWTAGVLVLARTPRAYDKLVELFSRHALLRLYEALVFGCPRQSAFTVDKPIGRDPVHRLRQSVRASQGKSAKTHVKVLECFGHVASRVEARLETGRTHQVRVHLTSEGHSILGDTTYGVPSQHQSKWAQLPESVKILLKDVPGQLLVARVLAFKHPFQDKELRWEAPVHTSFQAVWDALRSAC